MERHGRTGRKDGTDGTGAPRHPLRTHPEFELRTHPEFKDGLTRSSETDSWRVTVP